MAYPAKVSFKHQPKSSRLWALLTLLGIKGIALIPHMIILMILQFLVGIIAFVGIFAVLFTGKYPASWEKFIVNVARWNWRINAYFLCMTDKYPPFGFDAEYPADLSFKHQEKSSRLWALLTIIPIKYILLIPHMIVLAVMMFIGMLVMFIGVFAALFTGKYPESFSNYITTLWRYTWRIQAYFMCFTDKYPPISWKEEGSTTEKPEAPEPPEPPETT